MKISLWIKALFAALVLSFIVSFGLYYFSEMFFKAKNDQTIIKSAELGSSTNTDVVLPVGKRVPLFELKDSMAEGDLVKGLLDEDKTIKIINFWASWCEPCVEEFSSFARLVKAYEGSVSFYGLGQDETLKESKDFIEAFSSDFKNLEDVHFLFDEGKKTSKSYGVVALPETFIVDQKGVLVKRVSGFMDWDQEQVKVFFNNLMASKGMGSR